MAHIDPTVRLNVTTINDHIAKKVEPIFKKHIILGMLRSRGKIVTGVTGYAYDWRPRYRRNQPVRGGQYTVISFPQFNRWQKAELPYRQLEMGESYTKFEQLANKGKEAIVKFVANLVDHMTEDVMEFFPTEFFQDGNSTTTTNTIHGIESFMSTNGAVQASGSDASVAGLGNDTYAGLSTAQANYGGSWDVETVSSTSCSWPRGTGKSEYHFWSPLVINYTSTFSQGWVANTKTWINVWREAFRYMDTFLQTLQNARPDVYLLTPQMLNEAKASLEDKERFIVNQNSEIVKLGFPAVNWEGVDVLAEYGVPGATGYALNFNQMQLRSMQSKLFVVDQDKDIDRKVKKFSIDFYGNMVFWSPAYQGKFTDSI